MSLQKILEENLFVALLSVIIATASITWAISDQLLVRPRDEEHDRLERRIEELEAKQNAPPSSPDIAPNIAPEVSGGEESKRLALENQAGITRPRAGSEHTEQKEEPVGPTQPPRQESRGSNSPNIYQGGSGSIDVRINDVVEPPYEEPSEEEMREALLDQMRRRGLNVKDPNTVATENVITGIAVELLAFEKMGCRTAPHGAGYFCTYRIVSRPTAYSTEGTEAGDAHARGVTKMMNFLMGGETSTETPTRRFAKSSEGWIASEH